MDKKERSLDRRKKLAYKPKQYRKPAPSPGAEARPKRQKDVGQQEEKRDIDEESSSEEEHETQVPEMAEELGLLALDKPAGPVSTRLEAKKRDVELDKFLQSVTYASA